MARTDVFIVAVEPSGDNLGAALAKSLRSTSPYLKLRAIAGASTERAGLPSGMAIGGLAILGFTEGLRALPHVRRKVREAADIILADDPRAVVLIDSWGFMVRLAKRLKAKGYTGQIVKYVSPQVWATRPGRAKVLARHVDHLLSTQPMDAGCYEGTGLPLTYVGNPVLDQDYRRGDKAAFCTRHGLDPDRPILSVLPGSRNSELTNLLAPMSSNVSRLRHAVPDVQIVWILSDAIAKSWGEMVEKFAVGATIISQGEFIDALASIDVAHAVSGTITTQLACAGIPTVVVYRLSPITYFFASRLFKPNHISLVNIAAGKALMPEFMQEDVAGEGPRAALEHYLTDDTARAAASAALIAQTRTMGAGQQNASDRAAEALLAILIEGSAP